MKPSDPQFAVEEWKSKAADDYRSAHLLYADSDPPLAAVTFHAQQCVEKYLKALLLLWQVEPPRIHDIDQLLDLIAAKDDALANELREAGKLSLYAVTTRYLEFPDVSEEQAIAAVELALKVKKKLFPLLIHD